ncbi:hypothetical protein LP421_20340 [Rhizobium sp. RCAM05350]|nr:hypothetical protein LP421_20340 [Rhizobium sp. RCAM05350]
MLYPVRLILSSILLCGFMVVSVPDFVFDAARPTAANHDYIIPIDDKLSIVDKRQNE